MDTKKRTPKARQPQVRIPLKSARRTDMKAAAVPL